MGDIVARCFEACYDFVMKGGLKKAIVAIFAISLIMLTTAYLVFPQTTTSVALSVVGASAGTDFEPPEIPGENNVEYVGSFEGSAGPVGTGVGGEIRAEVNFETGQVSAEAEGETTSGGYLEGTVDLQDGSTEGTGNVNAFGLTGVPFRFEGQYSEDGSSAEGTWEATGEISGSGTWEIEVANRSEFEEIQNINE